MKVTIYGWSTSPSEDGVGEGGGASPAAPGEAASPLGV